MVFAIFRMFAYNFVFSLLITLIYFLILVGYKEILSLAFLMTFLIIWVITFLLDKLPLNIFMGIFQSIFDTLASFIPIAGTILVSISEIIVNFLFGIIIFLLINWTLGLFGLGIALSLIMIWKILLISLIFGILIVRDEIRITSQHLFGL